MSGGFFGFEESRLEWELSEINTFSGERECEFAGVLGYFSK